MMQHSPRKVSKTVTKYAIGVDVGATKVAIATVSDDFRVLRKHEVSTQVASGEILWNSIREVTTSFINESTGELLGIGIGSAAPLDVRTGCLSPVNIPIWRNFPIVSLCKELSQGAEVILHGDALALAHAENKLGAGKGFKNMLGMVVSTGVGGGLIIDGKIFTGDSGNSFFIGHHSINFEGRLCVCGRRGCLEAYSSGPQMVAIAQENGWSSSGDSFIDLAQSARDGDAIALDAISQGTHALARGIVNMVGSLDINHVVIGGGVVQSGDIFWKPLEKHMKNESKAIEFLKDVQLHKAELERDAGVLGAALAILG